MKDPPLNYIWPKFQGICGTFFFAKSPRFSNLKLDYFPHKKVFQDFRNRGKFIPSEVHLTKFSAKLENIFWRQKPPILKVEVGFSSDSKFFSNIFQIGANLSHLNFIWANFQQNQRTFFGRSVAINSARVPLSVRTINSARVPLPVRTTTRGSGVLTGGRLECTRKSGLCLFHFFLFSLHY